MDDVTVYSCEHPGCKVMGPAERMWNLKGKPRTIVCGKHGHEARKRELKVYRLSETLAYEQKIAQEREARAAQSAAFYTQLETRNRERSKRVQRADWTASS
jgi:hypothetical protein